MMGFLAPALLAGLLAIAIPIVVHLVQRERKRVVEFPSLMFLRKIPYQSVRRRAIRHWPLLLLRVAGLSLLVLAFARPWLTGAQGAAGASGGGREVVILVDRSASMGYGDRWERARGEARRVVQGLGPDDRAAVALFANDVEVAVRSAAGQAELLSALDRAAPGSGATRYGPALRAAAGLLESSAQPRREIVLISDFQTTGWDRGQELRLPAGVTLTPVAVGGPETENAAVVGLRVERERSGERERVTAAATVVNRGATRLADREVRLAVDGHTVDTQRVSIERGGSADVSFAAFPMSGRSVRVTAALASDALPADDSFHAVITSGGRVPVLVLEGANASPDASLYIVRALGVGGAPGFDTRVARADRVTPADLAAAAIVVLNDTRPPSGEAGRALAASVNRGAGLLVTLGDHTEWPADGPDLLPGALGAETDRSGTRGGTLGYLDLSHPVFEVFSSPRSGDLTAARFFRYRHLDATGAVLARFDDGAVALAERRVGQGRVLAWASTLDSYWNDFALKPVFVPFLHQAMKHLARYAEPKTSYTVGDVLDLGSATPAHDTAADAATAALVALTPAGQRLALASGDERRRFALAERGFYEFRSPGLTPESASAVAVNVAAAESDLAAFDPDDLVRAVTIDPAAASTEPAPTMTVEEQERRQAWWWYLLAAGLVLLLAETVVANRLPRIA